VIPLSWYLYLAAALFSIGIYGVMTRRNAIGALLSVEAMANAVNVNLLALGRYYGGSNGQLFAVFVMALTVAEVVVGLALVILMYRSHKHISIDEARELRH
jgi:NADH:ubiquinone oxidoreductase subunit K